MELAFGQIRKASCLHHNCDVWVLINLLCDGNLVGINNWLLLNLNWRGHNFNILLSGNWLSYKSKYIVIQLSGLHLLLWWNSLCNHLLGNYLLLNWLQHSLSRIYWCGHCLYGLPWNNGVVPLRTFHWPQRLCGVYWDKLLNSLNLLCVS